MMQRKVSRQFAPLALYVGALVAACSAESESPEGLGVATAAIEVVPADVSCVEVTSSGANVVVRRVDVTAGVGAALTLRGLPVGAVSFVAVAYPTVCREVTPSTEATWASQIERATLAAGVNTMVRLSLRRASGASVAVDFNDAPSYMCGPASRGDCDGDPLNGCETDIATSLVHCGACGRACSPYAATGACVAGQCTIASCQADRGDCDRSTATGCEAQLQGDPNNCGACGRSCALPNVQNGFYPCANGVCAAVVYAPVPYSQNRSCRAGWENCDGDASTGCETNLQTDASNCGRCGNRCPTAAVCGDGRCRAPNPDPFTATPIDLARGPRIDLPFTLLQESNSVLSCRGSRGRDVFFTFTLTRRELVSADAFGASPSPLLFFGRGTPAFFSVYTSAAPGDITCDSGGGCAVPGARVVALLEPGSYFLVVADAPSGGLPLDAEYGTIHVMHLPVNGTAASVGLLTSFTSYVNTFQGVTSGAGTALASCADATGPEATFWWMTCPELPAATPLLSNTCGSAFNTVLSYANTAGSGGACGGPSGARYCAQGSMVSTGLPAGANLHTLTVDGRQGASGSFNLYVEIGDSTW